MNLRFISLLIGLLLPIVLSAQIDSLRKAPKKSPMEIVRGYVNEHLDVLPTISIVKQPKSLEFFERTFQVKTVLGKKCSFLIFQIPPDFDQELSLYFSSDVVKSWGIQPIATQPDLQSFTPCFLRVKGMLAHTSFLLNGKKVKSKESGLFNKTIFIHDKKCLDETSFLSGQTYFLFFQVDEALAEDDYFNAFISLSAFNSKIQEKDFRKKLVEDGLVEYLNKKTRN